MDSNSDSPPGPLQQLYFAVEDVYYDVVEFLDDKLGIPVIKYFVEPIESRGMPSFPFAVLLSLFFLFALFASFSALSVPSSVDLSVRVFSGQSPVKLANISLSFDGKESLQFTGSDGKATFRNLPYGKSVVVNASKPGLQSADKKIKLEQARQSLSISLEPVSLRPPGVNQITIKVFDSRQVPLGGVKIEYYSVAGVLLGTKFTDATGIAEIGFDGENQVLSIDVSKQGFAPKERQMVFFSHKIPYEIQLDAVGEAQEQAKTAELVVQVKNSQGAPVDSFVTIHSQSTDEEVSSGRAGSSGQASFEIEFGSKLYAIATPATQEGKAKYATSFGDKNPFTLNKDPFILAVTLVEKNASFGTISLEVQDAATSAAVKDAKVTLYDFYQKKFLQEALSSDDGKASFDVVNSSLYFATIYATGFLPTSVSSLKAGDSKTIKLYKANSSNSGFVRATVSSFEGEKEKDATVKLIRDFDGLPLGIPSKKTNTTGYVLFEQVPSLAALRAVAEKGARNGESDSFTVQANQTENVSIALSQGQGNVTVAIVDDVFKTRISGKVRALAENQSELASCDTTPLPCVMALPAGVKFQLAAISANHEPSGIPGTLETVLAVEEVRGTQENPLEVSLVPSEFKGQLYASFQGVFEESAPTVQVTSVDRDKNYFAKLNVLYPSNMSNSRGGFYFRIGEDGTAQQTDFVITGIELPAGASINRKSEVSTANLCIGDEDVSTCSLSQGEGCKSVKSEYPVGMPVGMNVFKVHFFVRPESVSQEREANVSMRFRVYANSNGSFVRSPPDSQLADNVDFCTANTSQEILPLFAGTTCDETACISVKFKNSTGEYAPGFTTMLGKSFDAIIRVRQRENLYGNVQLRVSASQHFNFSNPTFENGGGSFVVENKEILATRQTTAEFGVTSNTTALHTTGFSQGFLYLLISSDNYEKELFPRINVAGTNPLRVSLNPAQIYVGEKATVTATVTNFFAGVPIQDAFMQAFYSYNPSLQAASNNSPGTYVYLLNLSASPPTKLGNLSVKALAGPDSGEAKINITRRDFLQLNASQIIACGQGAVFEAKHNGVYALAASAVVSAPSSCVSKLVGDTDSVEDSGTQRLYYTNWQANVSKNIKIIPPTPSTSQTSCNITISATLSDGFSSSHNVEYYYCTTPPDGVTPTPTGGTPTPTPSPSPTPVPVEFTPVKVNFLIDDSGVHALDPQFNLDSSPLIPSTAAEIIITNNLPNPATGISLFFEGDDSKNCLNYSYWNGTAYPTNYLFTVPANSKYSFPLTFGSQGKACPTYSRTANDGIALVQPQTMPMTVGCISCNPNRQEDSAAATAVYKATETGDFAVSRYPKGTKAKTSNNIQTPLMKFGFGGISISASESVFVGRDIRQMGFIRGQSPVTAQTDHSPIRTSSPLVMLQIQDAYRTLLARVNTTVAQEALGVAPTATMFVPISETGNGGVAATILHKYSITGYSLAQHGGNIVDKRCNIDSNTGECITACGGKDQPCCENVCFNDDLIENAVKDPNTQCLPDSAGIEKCRCGGHLQPACTPGRDPLKPFACDDSRMVPDENGVCQRCGDWYQLACDATRNDGRRCPGGGQSIGGQCVPSGAEDSSDLPASEEPPLMECEVRGGDIGPGYCATTGSCVVTCGGRIGCPPMQQRYVCLGLIDFSSCKKTGTRNYPVYDEFGIFQKYRSEEYTYYDDECEAGIRARCSPQSPSDSSCCPSSYALNPPDPCCSGIHFDAGDGDLCRQKNDWANSGVEPWCASGYKEGTDCRAGRPGEVVVESQTQYCEGGLSHSAGGKTYCCSNGQIDPNKNPATACCNSGWKVEHTDGYWTVCDSRGYYGCKWPNGQDAPAGCADGVKCMVNLNQCSCVLHPPVDNVIDGTCK